MASTKVEARSDHLVRLGVVGCDEPAMPVLSEQGSNVQLEKVCAFSHEESRFLGTGIGVPPVQAGNRHCAGEASDGSVDVVQDEATGDAAAAADVARRLD